MLELIRILKRLAFLDIRGLNFWRTSKVIRQLILISMFFCSLFASLHAEPPISSLLPPQSVPAPHFTGKRMSLNFQSIDVRAVLQIIADFTGINIVVSDQVKGKITLRLNEIPWDQALEIILITHGLDKRKTGNVLFIDTRAGFGKMEEAALKSKQTRERLEPLYSDVLQINYAKAADIAHLIQDKQNSLLSKQGKMSVDLRTNTLWIQDTASKIKEVQKLTRQLDIPVKQVQIEARIVAVTKDSCRDLGIRWGLARTIPIENRDSAGTLSLDKRLNLDLLAAPISGTSPASVGIALAKIGGNLLLDLELAALESEGQAELISSPRLITTNQQPALIESGQEIPYQESTSSGATSVSFKKAVLSLKVTPQITSDNKILMNLQINQDTASSQQFNGVPAILTKEIQTHVLVANGQTIVLGGVYRQDKNSAVKKVPFLGGLPVVGGLFKNKHTTLSHDELLIFITPKIMKHEIK